MLRGQNYYEKFKRGERLTRGQAMKAQCYVCNGEEESKADCQGVSCPLYPFRLYPGRKSRQDGTFKAPQGKEKGVAK